MIQYIIDGMIWVVESLLLGLTTIIVNLLNLLIYLASCILRLLFTWLPDTPFTNMILNVEGAELIGYVSWLVPVEHIAQVTFAWISCVFIYFGIRFLMKVGRVA